MSVKKLLLLPGDGVGPEVFEALAPILDQVRAQVPGLQIASGAVGYGAYQAEGTTLPARTLVAALESDAVLFGAEDTEAFANTPPAERPPSGLLLLRRKLGVYANLRPIRVSARLAALSPLKEEVVRGADLVIVRELLGGLYFGTPRGTETLADGRRRAVDSLVYSSDEIERVAHAAFGLARQRRGRLCSVDKGNVLATGALWRSVVSALGRSSYPDVELSHMYVDNCAMQLVRQPAQFDVIVTENTFGDILSDCAAMIPGSIGMLPSASLADAAADGSRQGLYEPIHGSAPDIAGRDIANPIGTVLSLAMALEHSLGAVALARRIERAVDAVLEAGLRTRDLGGTAAVGTRQMAAAIAAELGRA